MTELIILGSVAAVWFLVIWIKYKIQDYRESKRFWKRVDEMIEKHDKELEERWKKAIDATLPMIIKYYQKHKQSDGKNGT